MAEEEKNKQDKQEDKTQKNPQSELTKVIKAPPVHTEKELYRFVDLGLGRGLDGTNPTPWLNKTSFQVRRVTYDSIVGTEEGGALQSYEREVSSVQTHQAKIKGSLVVPQSPLTIGTDAEVSRSISTLRRTVGKRIVNRTIAFRDEFEDIFISDELTFEQRLTKWIIENLHIETGEFTKEQKISVGDILEHGKHEHIEAVVKACYDFIQFYRITHYVSAIELGAAEYKTFTEDEYQAAVSVAGSLGIDKLASFVYGQDFTKKKKKTASDVKSIGRIDTNQTVERGSHSEAVVSIKIQPITNLIRSEFLRLALKKALVDFVEVQSDRSDGPYIISCNNDKFFLKVQPDASVVACDNIRDSSLFYILPTDNKSHPYEFYIAHYSDTSNSSRATDTANPLVIAEPSLGPIARYLEAPLNVRGTNQGPLFVRHHVAQSNSRFVIHSRLVSSTDAVALALTSWTSGREIFFINCTGRKRRKDGYLCVRQSQGVNYITSCVRDTIAHNNHSIFMLFRLLPGSYRTKGFPGATSVETHPTGKIEVTSELEEDRHKDTAQLLQVSPSSGHHATPDVPMMEMHTSEI